MKPNKLRIIFITSLVLVSIAVLFFRLYAFTFSNFIVDENDITVFYPKGVANEYKGITVVSPNEDHRIWMYKLQSKEIQKADNNLSIGVWRKTSYEESEYLHNVFFNDFLFDYTNSDEIYYCLFDSASEDYKQIDINDTLLFGQENLLFVYNKTTSEYYCVSKTVH